jgi:alkylated DNA repair dioxygenase AlkB
MLNTDSINYETTVPGLFYIENIEEIEENSMDIIGELDNLNWEPLNPKSENSRLVQHYGYKYSYNSRKIDINNICEPIPEFLTIFQNILTNICLKLNITNDTYVFNQCIVNNYFVGQGISQHIDLPSFGGVIGCFTIGSGTTMKFTYNGEHKEIYVKPNSLYIMSGDSRYVWSHSMPVKKSDVVNGIKIKRDRRISITFRNVFIPI